MKKRWFILAVAAGVIIPAAVLILRDMSSNNASFSANFADNVLRPIFGNTATIKLETLIFNTQDTVRQLTYNPVNKLLGGGGDQIVNVSSNLVWKPVLIDKKNNGEKIIQTASYNPDPTRPYALVHLIKIESNKVYLRAVAGKKEPASEVGKPGTGVIPDEIKQNKNLVAAFNGGFQYRDGQYGMVVENETYLPLRAGLATLLVSKENKVSIEDYEGGYSRDKYILARQNGEMLLKNGTVIPSSSDKLAKIWGRTITSSMYTWRSGVGVDSQGNLIYAAGSALIPETLGESLRAAGAVNAMQLDINPYWVRFSVFKPLENNTYEHQSLFPKMFDGGKDFLNGYQKDFFYVYLREPLSNNDVAFMNTRVGWNKE
ncbi:MAG TPA: phosphodiester glycosidase family protein [Patescibacteria group bacterium]